MENKSKGKMLGISLTTILEAKEKGVFYKDEKGNIEQIGKTECNEFLLLDFTNKCFKYLIEPTAYSGDNWKQPYGYDLSFNKYGITWALTKEELL